MAILKIIPLLLIIMGNTRVGIHHVGSDPTAKEGDIRIRISSEMNPGAGPDLKPVHIFLFQHYITKFIYFSLPVYNYDLQQKIHSDLAMLKIRVRIRPLSKTVSGYDQNYAKSIRALGR